MNRGQKVFKKKKSITRKRLKKRPNEKREELFLLSRTGGRCNFCNSINKGRGYCTVEAE